MDLQQVRDSVGQSEANTTSADQDPPSEAVGSHGQTQPALERGGEGLTTDRQEIEAVADSSQEASRTREAPKPAATSKAAAKQPAQQEHMSTASTRRPSQESLDWPPLAWAVRRKPANNDRA